MGRGSRARGALTRALLTLKRFLPRLAATILSLLGLSILSFIIARVLPGDPVRAALGPNTPQYIIDQVRKQMGFDKPIYLQYFYWLAGALQGNLGMSLFTRRAVSIDILKFFPATLELIIWSTIFQVIPAILLGVIAGRYANTLIDNLIRVFSYVGAAFPSFVISIVEILVFGQWFHILPYSGRLDSSVIMPPNITGMITFDALLTGNIPAFVNAFLHIILPASALAFTLAAVLARIVRAGVLENSNKDYILSATSHGIPERKIMLKYILKPSLIPAMAVIGLNFGNMLSSLFVTEVIFNWPGFAWYGLNAMLTKDINAIVGVIVITGVVYAIVNIAIDVLTDYLDPRISATGMGA